MKIHPKETTLALYAGGDLSGWDRIRIAAHTVRCADCSNRVQEFRSLQAALKDGRQDMPADLDWDRLSEEMSANIRLGLEAGECVAPTRAYLLEEEAESGRFSWRRKWARWDWISFDSWRGWQQGLALGVLGIALLSGAFWLNVPASQSSKFAQSVRRVFDGRPSQSAERGVILEATAAGIEVREGGRAYTVLHPVADVKPASLTADLNGSMRARYVDSDTGQVTIANVYAE